jgi:hypothetical protein
MGNPHGQNPLGELNFENQKNIHCANACVRSLIAFYGEISTGPSREVSIWNLE